MSTELFIRPDIIVPGDAAATVKNIAASEALFGMIPGLFAFIGEGLFYLWLLIKGVNVEVWCERALESI